MSNAVPVGFVTQYTGNIIMLAEQRVSRLIGAVRRKSITGENWTIERLGGVEMSEITNRHGDTPLTETPQDRRWGYVKAYDVADLIDKEDRVKMIINLDDPYARKQASAVGRAMDRTIIGAFDAAAREGHTGATVTNFPAGQTLTDTAAMSVSKLLDIKQKFDASESDFEGETRYIGMRSDGFRQLLNTTEVKSADYNTVKALVHGELNTFLGFIFIRSELFPDVVGDSTKYTGFAWTASAIEFGDSVPVSTRIDQRPDKRYATQIYTRGAWGAVRTEDVRVIKFSAAKTAT